MSSARPVAAAPASFRQAGNRIVADGEVGIGFFGYSLALSADGNTALAGGFYDDGSKGAAWVLTRSGGAWTQQQGSRIEAGGETGASRFGTGVSATNDASKFTYELPTATAARTPPAGPHMRAPGDHMCRVAAQGHRMR